MIKVFVDSASSIKKEEQQALDVQLIPLRILLGEEEYLDGVDLSYERFYDFLIKEKGFPKTSLPDLDWVKEKVEHCVSEGDEVIVLTLSSEISGTYNALQMLFENNDKVRVIDSRTVVGGMRFLVMEINKYRHCSLDEIEMHVKQLIPRLKLVAIPETLAYLLRGGRMTKKQWLVGNMLNIKPIISICDGKVAVIDKKIGLMGGMKYMAAALEKFGVDEQYGIIASYTYNKDNLEKALSFVTPQCKEQILVYDDICSVISCHWGPNAIGYFFVAKNI
ncbi:MAG: DegV family protein [Corallococcus sp.]|nr:DegV family protein [Corallococcus sp.]